MVITGKLSELPVVINIVGTAYFVVCKTSSIKDVEKTKFRAIAPGVSGRFGEVKNQSRKAPFDFLDSLLDEFHQQTHC